MMSDPIVRVQADMPDAVVRIEVANQGKDGYTPKRGVDYWTEEDVQEIRDYVDEQIGTGGGGSGAVSSVNGKTGAVVLTPEDIGAQPKGDYALKEEVPQIDDAAVSAESTWSSKNTVERFLPEFSESGAAVECHPFPLCPLNVSTTFEPAQTGSGEPSLDNIRPISGYDKLGLTRCGKNLFNDTVISLGQANGTIGAGKITITRLNAYSAVAIDQILSENTDYYFGFKCNASGSFNVRISCSDDDGAGWTDVNTSAGGRTFNSGDHTLYRFTFYATAERTEPLAFSEIQLELGSTATAYEPYQGDTYTVHLGDTVYGGTHDWSKGELMAEWKMMPLDGTEAWSVNLSNQNGSPNRFHLTLTGYEVGNHQVIADRYKTVKWSAHGSNVNSVVLYRDAAWETTRLSIASDLNEDEFKAYLAAQYAAGTPVQFAYKLATPITIRLAPLEIMPLDGTNVLSSNPGNTTVSGKLDPIYLHEQNKAAAAKLAGMETRLQALESAAVNNA